MWYQMVCKLAVSILHKRWQMHGAHARTHNWTGSTTESISRAHGENMRWQDNWEKMAGINMNGTENVIVTEICDLSGWCNTYTIWYIYLARPMSVVHICTAHCLTWLCVCVYFLLRRCCRVCWRRAIFSGAMAARAQRSVCDARYAILSTIDTRRQSELSAAAACVCEKKKIRTHVMTKKTPTTMASADERNSIKQLCKYPLLRKATEQPPARAHERKRTLSLWEKKIFWQRLEENQHNKRIEIKDIAQTWRLGWLTLARATSHAIQCSLCAFASPKMGSNQKILTETAMCRLAQYSSSWIEIPTTKRMESRHRGKEIFLGGRRWRNKETIAGIFLLIIIIVKGQELTQMKYVVDGENWIWKYSRMASLLVGNDGGGGVDDGRWQRERQRQRWWS